MKSLSTYIAHVDGDRRFVPLCARLLELHHYQVWYSANGAGVENRLATTDVLLVATSWNAKGSESIAREIEVFRRQHPDRRIIPLLLDDMDPGEVDRNLELNGAPFFGECLLEGFRDLFHTLGNDFLSNKELAEQRVGTSRRRGHDRRKSDVGQRIFIGLQITFTRQTGRSVADIKNLSPADLESLRRPIKSELARYVFRSPLDGTQLRVDDVLEQGLAHMAERISRNGPLETVEVFRRFAVHIMGKYDVKMVERRNRPRRQGSGARL